MTREDKTADIIEQVSHANATGAALQIRGGDSKRFLGCRINGDVLDVSAHSGIVDYEPNELVMTVRAGTTLDEIEAVLAQHRQIPGFDPPRYSPAATIGGTLACNLSGPARPWRGSIRDSLLGIRLINGRGEHLRFGGRVIKNVAGFDASRLQAGAFGSLGVVTELSLKVLPKPETSVTLAREIDAQSSLQGMNVLAGTNAPISGAAWAGGRQYIRLSGNAAAVTAAARKLGGDKADDSFWEDLRDLRPRIFGTPDDRAWWRFSVKATTQSLLSDDVVIDWGGALRFMREATTLDVMSERARHAGGQVTRISHNSNDDEFQQQPAAAVQALHERLKRAFDPERIFNPGRLYGWL